MNDALGSRRADRQPDLLKRISGRIQHLTKLGQYIAAVDALLAGRGDDVARRHRFHAEAALEGVGRALEPQILLRGREHDALRGLGLGLANLDEIARADLGIGALEAVEADDVEALVLGIGQDRSEEHTSELQSLMRISYAGFCLKKIKN